MICSRFRPNYLEEDKYQGWEYYIQVLIWCLSWTCIFDNIGGLRWKVIVPCRRRCCSLMPYFLMKMTCTCIYRWQYNIFNKMLVFLVSLLCRNTSLTLGECPNEHWQALDKGLWTGAMSPFETKFVDIRQLGSNTDASINVSMQEGWNAAF